MDIVLLILGLALILIGANMLTDGSSDIAKRYGVSDMTIGLTVVAFGTSAPELVISAVSAVQGNSELAIGNVVGSNIFNILAIIGVTAIVRPIPVNKGVITADIPFVIISSLALLALGFSSFLGQTGDATITRSDGILLLLFFVIFMRYTFASAKQGATASEDDKTATKKPMPMWKACVWVASGLAGLIFGGKWFVSGASGIATSVGVSDAVIGLTIVAAGTSLPELATSLIAAVKGKTGIALGNVIGSNIFNIFLVLGISATIRPLVFGSIGLSDLIVLTAASFLFWLFGWFYKKSTITRAEGCILFAFYVAYISVLVYNS